MAALAVGTIADRLNADRMPTVVELLKREAASIGPMACSIVPSHREAIIAAAGACSSAIGRATSREVVASPAISVATASRTTPSCSMFSVK